MLVTSPPWQVAGRAHVQVTEQLQGAHMLLHVSTYFETEISASLALNSSQAVWLPAVGIWRWVAEKSHSSGV